MSSFPQHIDSAQLRFLKEKYFGDAKKVKILKKGDYIIHQGQKNQCLYLVVKGSVAGYLDIGSGNRQEVFRSYVDMFVGVHSFFSKSDSAYADVVALEESELAYVEYSEYEGASESKLLEEFVPVIVHELSARQLFAKDAMLEKEVAMKKLYLSDKLATLGQMAAGLAHELNNAIGVIDGNTGWFAQEIYDVFSNSKSEELFEIFVRGFEHGQIVSSGDVRQRKRQIEKKYKFTSSMAKMLAKIDLDDKTIRRIGEFSDPDEYINEIHSIWSMGVSLHDVRLATKHSVHVLNSVKQLSVSDQARSELNVNSTIKEALTLLKKLVEKVDLRLELNDIPNVSASRGELIQIWVNIIKNGCESMINAETFSPQMEIITSTEGKNVLVSISNNGPQISDELKKKIFQPNFTTKKGGLSFGLGLGLSIVQRLIDGYNGRIYVESTEGNTIFKILLPEE